PPARPARPAHPRRVGLRPGQQGRGRTLIRRDRQRLRAAERRPHHQPRVRTLDRGPRQRTPHRRRPRPPHPSGHDCRDGGRELPPPGRPTPEETLTPRSNPRTATYTVIDRAPHHSTVFRLTNSLPSANAMRATRDLLRRRTYLVRQRA